MDTFTIRGRLFHVRADVRAAKLRPYFENDDEPSAGRMLQNMDAAILALLWKADRASWRQLRQGDDVSLADLHDVLHYCLEAQCARPTRRPPGSWRSPSVIWTAWTAASSSRGGAECAA